MATPSITLLRRGRRTTEEDDMGDKSPKAKDKAKKQDDKQKDQKKTDARNKANIMAPKKKP